MIDRVGDALQRRGAENPRIERKQPDGDVCRAAQRQTADQHAARTVSVDGVSHRGLHDAADDVHHRDDQAKLDKAQAEALLQHGKQRHQHEIVEMADEMRRADQAERLQFVADFRSVSVMVSLRPALVSNFPDDIGYGRGAKSVHRVHRNKRSG